MNVLDLFSGIGGFSLGLERAGMRAVAFCEIDPYCQAVLRKHWPDVPLFRDVTTLRFDRYSDDKNEHGGTLYDEAGTRLSQFVNVDVIVGSFPCQDISIAGKGAGIEGSRSGLWSEYARIIGEVRPSYVIVENVTALLGRGLERVLGDLAALGFDAEWHCIPASAVGAPHRRDRVWIVAHTIGLSERWRTGRREEIARWSHNDAKGSGDHAIEVAAADSAVMERQWLASQIQAERNSFGGSSWWHVEPNVGRVAHGIPFRVERFKALENAIVPQIAEIIGRAIISVSE